MEAERAQFLERGAFTLSLDFELIWGTLDVKGPSSLRGTYERERGAVLERLLTLLIEFEISATWCVLGHVFLKSCTPLGGIKHPDIIRPAHSWVDGDWFQHDPCGTEETDPTFYGASLVEKLKACPVPQEIGCHSFSHVIFGDEGCSRETASSELAACVRLAAQEGLRLQSFAFPRNRVGHLDVLREHGLLCYRGPEPVWWEHPAVPPIVKRAGHFFDVAIARRPPAVTPHYTDAGLWNIPGSMMYFPMHGRRRYLPVSVRVRRALKGIDLAVERCKVFHLWFHPTNLVDQEERMFAGLRAIFEHVAERRRNGELAVVPMRLLLPSRRL